MINADAIRRASMALNAVFNAEQVQALIVAVEHLMDGYVRQITAPPLPPEPSVLSVPKTAESVARVPQATKTKEA